MRNELDEPIHSSVEGTWVQFQLFLIGFTSLIGYREIVVKIWALT